MFRVFSLAVVVAVMQSAFCDFAFADPDPTIVRLAIDKEESSVAVLGQSRVDVVAAVFRGLENCNRPADGVTAGPWLRLPETKGKDADNQPQLTVFISDRIGVSTAYIAVTPKFPFSIVTAIATELRTCGFTNVRLYSDGDVPILMDVMLQTQTVTLPNKRIPIGCTGTRAARLLEPESLTMVLRTGHRATQVQPRT